MSRKPKPQPDNPEQFKRFIETVREVGAEDGSPNFERVFRKVASAKKDREKSNKDLPSD